MHKLFKRIFLSFLFILALANIGLSSWVITNYTEQDNLYAEPESTQPVCYNKSTDVYYTKVETALNAATSGQIINVLPGVDTTISSNVTVKSGVTLNVMPNFNIGFKGVLSFDTTNIGSTAYIQIQKTYDGTNYTNALKLEGVSAKYSYSLKYSSTTFTADRFYINVSKVYVDDTEYTAEYAYNTLKYTSVFNYDSSSNDSSSKEYRKYFGVAAASTSTVNYSAPSINFQGSKYKDPRGSYLTSGYYEVYCPSFSFSVTDGTGVSATGATPTYSSSASLTDYNLLNYDSPSDYSTYVNAHISANPSNYVYKVTTLNIASNVTLTNNGTIFVGGTLNGGNGGSFGGQSISNVAKIYLNNNAKIINNSSSTFHLYGFLESSESNTANINFLNGSKLYAPFVVTEHRGGSVFLGYAGTNDEIKDLLTSMVTSGGADKHFSADNMKTFPFNRYFFNNMLYINYRFEYGSTFSGIANLYADNAQHSLEIEFIGTSDSAVIETSSGTVVSGYIKKGEYVSTYTYDTKNTINIAGSFTLNPLVFSIYVYKSKTLLITITAQGNIDLSTKNVMFPISYYFDINLLPFESGSASTVDLSNQAIKLLPGCNMSIDSNVTVNAKSILVYENENFYDTTKYTYDKNVNGYYIPGSQNTNQAKTGTFSPTNTVGNTLMYPSTSDASLVINGTLNSTSLGGYVSSSKAGGIVNITSNASASENEVYSTESASIEIYGYNVASYRDPQYLTISHNATANVYNNLETVTSNLSTGINYISATSSKSEIGFGKSSDTLSISGSDSISKDGGSQTYTLTTNNLIGNNVVWSSSNTSVATISGDMLTASLTPVGEGSTTITASVYNDSTLVQSVSKTISIKGNSINIIIKDSKGNQLFSTSTDNSLTYTADVSNYVKLIYDGSESSSYTDNSTKLPTSKDLVTVSNWNITTNNSSTSISAATSIDVSGNSGDTIIIEPNTYTTTTYYLAYMSSHASNGTSYLSTSAALDESSKSNTSAQLDSSGEYCYIQSGQSYTLYAKGYKETSWGSTTYYDFTIKDSNDNGGSSTWSRSGSIFNRTYSVTEYSGSFNISSYISIESSSSKHSF